ncbi:HEPN domain-containing protein [Dyadobacter crusticola]|uniref:HEPN domain-containing protein n=1 Tax=Dyadobacter crusticola TaxID=292407 RepID=UPI0009FDAF73|nr:HEPN domain-containing protein [Dyadobacter crusticola]
MGENIDYEKVSAYWLQTSDDDFVTMENMFKTRDYHWALFIGHIVIEKLLKGCVVRETGKYAPFTHDLTRLCKLSNIEFSKEQLDWMDTITTFNIDARYDDYKLLFYQNVQPSLLMNG